MRRVKNFLKNLKLEVTLTHEKWIQKAEEESRSQAKEKAMSIITDVMQRYTAEQVSGSTLRGCPSSK